MSSKRPRIQRPAKGKKKGEKPYNWDYDDRLRGIPHNRWGGHTVYNIEKATKGQKFGAASPVRRIDPKSWKPPE